MTSLFSYPSIYIDGFKKDHNLDISKEFVSCANKQLTNIFEKDSGIKVNKLISIGWAWEKVFFYQKDLISKFASTIWVNNQNTPITIAWKAKSGRMYDLADTDIDCSDIEFWFEGFDALLYNRQMYPRVELPFKLKDLTYTLIITRLNLDSTIEMLLKEAEVSGVNGTMEAIDTFIDGYNTLSEKKDRKYGVIHNWKREVKGDKLVYEIDTGSTGAHFFKKMLQFLSELNVFKTVEVS